MPNTDEKVSKFLLAINQYAEEQRQQILDEVQQYIDQELKKAESEVLNDVYHLIQKETADMRNQIRMQLSRKELEAKKALLSHRSELTAKVFDQAEEKIRAFTDSPAYEPFLIQAACRLSTVLKVEDVVLQMREADVAKYGDAVLKVFGPAELKASKDIRLGGLTGESVSLGLLADETLDSRLEAQREWFMEHSGLIVR